MNNAESAQHKTRNCIISIAAFAAVSALGNIEQVLDSPGELVVLASVTAIEGVDLTAGEGFPCPSSAFYFVHYRLKVRRNDPNSATSCVMSLFVGSNEIEVSFLFKVEL